MNGVPPGIQIVASGVCQQGATVGEVARQTIGCIATKQINDGAWQVKVMDLSVVDGGPNLLIAFPGRGSNITGGVSFGQGDVVNVDGDPTIFAFEGYHDDGEGPASFDCEYNFIVVKWPGGVVTE
jgi:hypothetical protein